MSLRDLIVPALQNAPESVAVIGHSSQLTYRELHQQASRLASDWLRGDLRPCDRVALWMRNSPELVVSYLACWKAGLIPVPIDLRYQQSQTRFILHSSGARAVVLDAEKQGELAAIEGLADLAQVIVASGAIHLPGAADFHSLTAAANVDSEPAWPVLLGDHISTIFYTSGTTSRPKGVVHSGQRTWRRVAKLIRECQLGADTVSLVCLSLLRPMAFQLQMLAVLAVGGCVVTLPSFSAEEFWRAYRATPAKTLLAFAPNMLAAVLNHPAARSADYSRLVLCLVGADTTPPALHALFKEITGKELVEMCGMTETGPYAMNPPFDVKKIGSIGQALEGILLRLVDENGEDVPAGQSGQILVRTSDAMVGYWNDSLETFRMVRDGWLFTGDLGRSDADGYVWFQGRLKDVILRNGNNISPLEIEGVLAGHPAVLQSVVVGVDDPPHGQAVEAFVTWRPNRSETPTVEELAAYVAQRLDALSVPRAIYNLTEWPRTAQGKIDRKRLQWIAAAGGVPV